MPTRAYMKAMTFAAHALLRTISKVAGSEIVEDAMAFFRAFEGMEEGFRERARRVEDLLANPGNVLRAGCGAAGGLDRRGAVLCPPPRGELDSCERTGGEPPLLGLRSLTSRGRPVVTWPTHANRSPPARLPADTSRLGSPADPLAYEELGGISRTSLWSPPVRSDTSPSWPERWRRLQVVRVPFLQRGRARHRRPPGCRSPPARGPTSLRSWKSILIVSDSESVLEELRSALEDDETEIRELRAGEDVRLAVEQDPPDLVITDLQVGNMGGMAICLDLHLEESGDRIPHVPVLILLDRRADVFLARRSASEGWLVKPLDAIRIRRAARAVLDGGTFYDESYKPLPLAADR